MLWFQRLFPVAKHLKQHRNLSHTRFVCSEMPGAPWQCINENEILSHPITILFIRTFHHEIESWRGMGWLIIERSLKLSCSHPYADAPDNLHILLVLILALASSRTGVDTKSNGNWASEGREKVARFARPKRLSRRTSSSLSVRITFPKAQFQEPKGFKIMMFMFAIALSLYGTGHKFSWHVLHLSQVIKVSSFNPCWQSECFFALVQKLENTIFACNTIEHGVEVACKDMPRFESGCWCVGMCTSFNFKWRSLQFIAFSRTSVVQDL